MHEPEAAKSEGLDPTPSVGRESIFADRRKQGHPAKRPEALEIRHGARHSSTRSRGGGASNCAEGGIDLGANRSRSSRSTTR
jgi:hypothetical protein